MITFINANRKAAALVGLIVFLAIPLVVDNKLLIHLAILGMLYAVVASNWDLTLGYAGVFNFAHLAFFGIGAYTSGILAVKLGISPWIGIPCGAVTAAIASLIVSIPAIRLRGIYVALLTFACSQLVLLLLLSQPLITGGQQGLTGVPQLQIGDFRFRESKFAHFYLVGLLLLCSTVFLRRLVTSDFGLSLIALRDFEEYAVARGIPLARQRLLAFLLSSIFPGLAGGVYAHFLIVASPDIFGFSLAILLLSMVLVGGVATIYGPVLIGVVMTYVSELMASSAWMSEVFGVSRGPVRFMFVAVIIVLTMRFFPQGVWGLIKEFSARARKSDAPADAERP
jgi:branched-chain amino acid transport system permease protein